MADWGRNMLWRKKRIYIYMRLSCILTVTVTFSKYTPVQTASHHRKSAVLIFLAMKTIDVTWLKITTEILMFLWFLAWCSWFEKMKCGLWHHLAICLCIRLCLSICLFIPLIFLMKIMRSPCCLCLCLPNFVRKLTRSPCCLCLCLPDFVRKLTRSPCCLCLCLRNCVRKLTRSPCCLCL
jgi:hypothetical protein